jgi:ribosomal protein S18 acetylase RimI-like enzyme
VIGRRHAVRAAEPVERAELAAMLARSFHDDPVMSWFFPDSGRRLGQSRRFFAMRLRQLLPQGETYTVDGTTGAAIWALPERWRLGVWEDLRIGLALLPALGRRVGVAVRGVELIERAHPADPHYYLAVLGTDPTAQGQGIGSALLQPVLETCDRDEIPAYLESSKERNIDFYARHGFRVTGELTLPEGPPVWSMWRDPRP